MRTSLLLLALVSLSCAHGVGSSITTVTCKDLSQEGSASARLEASTVVARWAQGELTYGEIAEGGKPHFRQLRNKFFSDIHSHELELINGRIAKVLIAAEANRRGQSDEDYMSSVAQVASDVEEEDVRAFFDANQSRLNRSFSETTDQIRHYLKQEEQKKLVRAEINRLYESAQVELLLPEPNLIPVGLNLAGRPRKGPADAAITIVEFSDFECPYCRVAASDIKRRLVSREDKIAVVFLHFPLSFHKQAKSAAIASECAHRQEKFWQFHDAIFESHRNLSQDRYLNIAEQLELDLPRFKTCLSDPRAALQVEADMKQGSDAGVRGAPNFFINGLPAPRGIPSAEDLDVLIEKASNSDS